MDVTPDPSSAGPEPATFCDLCASGCGVRVRLSQDGAPVLVRGERAHPVNRGALCARGAALAGHHHSPARLTTPLRRTGPRGSGEFEPIGWDAALDTLAQRLSRLRRTAPERLTILTGPRHAPDIAGRWAHAFGTPNLIRAGSASAAAAAPLAGGNAAGTALEPDWARCKILVLFGMNEGPDPMALMSNLGPLRARGVKIVSVDPVRGGAGAVADDWLGITPGTDGLLILSIVHCLLRAGRVDLDYLARFTDAPVILTERPDTADHLMPMTDADGQPMVIDRVTRRPAPATAPGVRPDLAGRLRRAGHTHRTVFQHISERYLAPDYAPERVASACGLPPERIRALAADLAAAAFLGAFELPVGWTDLRGDTHAHMQGRPAALHAGRGIAGHSNGYQTLRALELLRALLGTIDAPGGMRYRAPAPAEADLPEGPDDLQLDAGGAPLRLDAAFSWAAPMGGPGRAQAAIRAAHAGGAEAIDTLLIDATDPTWSEAMAPVEVMAMLADETRLPFIVATARHSTETVAFADLVLPEAGMLEQLALRSLRDGHAPAPGTLLDGIRPAPVAPPAEGPRDFRDVLLALGARLQLPGFAAEDGGPRRADLADCAVNHEPRPGTGALMGWRIGPHGLAHGRGAPNQGQIDSYAAHGGLWQAELSDAEAHFRPWNAAWQDRATELGLQDGPAAALLPLYATALRRFQLAAEGHGDIPPPEDLRGRVLHTCAPLPAWYAPLIDGHADPVEYPFHAVTRRPPAGGAGLGHATHGLGAAAGDPVLFLPPALWRAQGFAPGDWARVTSLHGEITVQVAEGAAQNPATVWAWAAGAVRPGAWALDPLAPPAARGVLLGHLVRDRLSDGTPNADPVSGEPARLDLRVRIERVPPAQQSHPALAAQADPTGRAPAAMPPDRPGIADRLRAGRGKLSARARDMMQFRSKAP